MTTTSYCTRCGALVVRDELGTWTSMERRYEERGPSAVFALEECCAATQEHHRPEADESYQGPRDFAAEETARRARVRGDMSAALRERIHGAADALAELAQ